MENESSPKRFERKPNLELTQRLSRDGRYWIFKRVETWIVSAKYLDVIAKNRAIEAPGAAAPTAEKSSKRKGKRDADSNG
jgi:hypothetical protein